MTAKEQALQDALAKIPGATLTMVTPLFQQIGAKLTVVNENPDINLDADIALAEAMPQKLADALGTLFAPLLTTSSGTAGDGSTGTGDTPSGTNGDTTTPPDSTGPIVPDPAAPDGGNSTPAAPDTSP